MIDIRTITKRFGSFTALDGVNLQVRSGEIHALLGENGAGKTTLMRVLFGLLRPDEGEIQIDHRPSRIRRPQDALAAGIGMVHQHFMLVERLSVADNVLLGDRHMPQHLPERKRHDIVAALAERLAIEINPAAIVESLSVGQRQRVELLKALRHPLRTLILDEPTAVHTPDETESLFATLRRLRGDGCGIVFITHKLDEVLRLCDRVTVLRRGRSVLSAACGDVNANQLAEAIIGSDAPPAVSPVPAAPSARTVFELRRISMSPDDRGPALRDVSMHIRAGEIVGIAGVDGNGQHALLEVALGLTEPLGGVVQRPRGRIACIPDDRQREALVLSMSLDENSVLREHGDGRFSRFGFLKRGMIHRHAAQLIGDFDVRCHDSRAPIAALSGGNQQKLVVARELDGDPEFIVAANPTRGLDIAAAAFVRWRLIAAAARPAAVLLISADVNELTELSHRILVLHRGVLRDANWPAGGMHAIGRLMAGVAE